MPPADRPGNIGRVRTFAILVLCMSLLAGSLLRVAHAHGCAGDATQHALASPAADGDGHAGSSPDPGHAPGGTSHCDLCAHMGSPALASAMPATQAFSVSVPVTAAPPVPLRHRAVPVLLEPPR